MTEISSEQMSELARAVFQSLREMDRECETGLCDYGQHAGLGSLQVELGCHRGLRLHLTNHGYRLDDSEWPYPGTKERCDLRLWFPDGARVLLEVKNIWAQWFFERVKTSKPKLSDLHHDIVKKLSRID